LKATRIRKDHFRLLYIVTEVIIVKKSGKQKVRWRSTKDIKYR